jgi:hypothetical protein
MALISHAGEITPHSRKPALTSTKVPVSVPPSFSRCCPFWNTSFQLSGYNVFRTLRAHPQKSVFLGHFAKKQTSRPILLPFIFFTKSFYKGFKIHSSFFNYVCINCNGSQSIVAAYLLRKAGDFGFAVPECIAKNTEL